MTVNYMQFTDYSNEKSGVSVVSANLDAGNFAAQQTLALALSVATGALSLADLTKRTMSDILLDSPSVPTNVYAQREIKWLVQYQGNTSGKLFTLEIPAANLTGNLVANTDIADVSSADWLAWIEAFEDIARSPDNDTETVTFRGARVVGRNI